MCLKLKVALGMFVTETQIQYAFLTVTVVIVLGRGEDALVFFPWRQTVNALGVWSHAAWMARGPDYNSDNPVNLIHLLRDAS